MSELEEIKGKLDKIGEDVGTIKVTLLGNPGTQNGGVVGDVKTLKKDYYSFKNKAILIAGVIIGSGVLGIGISQALAMLGR